MATGLVADVNIEGHFAVLLAACSGPEWGEWWAELNVPLYTFAGLGLSPDAADGEVWRVCQEHDILLITGN